MTLPDEKENLMKIIAEAWSWVTVSKESPTFGDAMEEAAEQIMDRYTLTPKTQEQPENK
jgi:hypothetical protein